MQFIAVLGGVEDRIVECFRQGGGVPYSAYGRFHQVMAEESAQTVGGALMDTILPMVEGLTESLSRGIKVLDIGCGSGRTLNLLAETFPHSSFMGYDFSEEGIARARAEAERKGLKNVCFVVKDVAMINEVEQYDLVTAFDAIHDQAQPARVLGVIAQALKPSGTFLMQDIAGSCEVHKNMEHPVGPFLYTISCMHCMTVSLAAGGAGLGTMWGIETARAMLAEAGFASVRVEQPPHDVMNYFYVARKN
jgi:2-polyprenyl-3-methyl-5-hydroxy-6-metoxy-1,4-benzoquinol methylase